jgi:rsbT antagonist protein RsbS
LVAALRLLWPATVRFDLAERSAIRNPRSAIGNAMQVPILKQGGYLIASIQSVLSDADLIQLRDNLGERVGTYRSRGVIIDVTVLDVIDSFATRMLRSIAHMLKLRGAETVIVGIQPDVAFAMVQLGLTLEGVGTALDLEEGLAYLDVKTKRVSVDGN